MKTRKLGTLEVSALGLGCMSMSALLRATRRQAGDDQTHPRRPSNGASRCSTRRKSYGPFVNEELVGEALEPIRDSVVIATKFGFDIDLETGERAGRHQQPARAYQGRGGCLPEASADGSDRPVLSAPRRSGRADRGCGGRGQGADRGGQGEAFRPVGSRRADHPPRARGPAGDRGPKRILAVLARPEKRASAGAGGTGHRFRAVQPARRGFSHRQDRREHQVRPDRFPQQRPALLARGAQGERGSGRTSSRQSQPARA